MWFASLRKLLLHRFSPGAVGGSPPGPAMPSVYSLNREMPIEVMKDFDTVLLFGRLADVSPTALTVRRASSELCFPILKRGGAVLVRGYDEQMNPVLFCGRLAQSSGLECTVGELEAIPYRTDRKYARWPLCPPASIEVLDGAEPGLPQPCQLLNISRSGVCIVCEHIYAVGQILYLRIKTAISGQCAPYRCKVVRATPRRGDSFEYGMLFIHLSGNQLHCLAQEIQSIQNETKKSCRVSET